MPTAAESRARIIADLARVEAFARECAKDGPEYGDDDAPYAFFLAGEVLRANEPLPNESAETYCVRVEVLVRAVLAEKTPGVPAAHEALTMIRAET